MKHGKKYRASAAKYDLTKKYNVANACQMVQDMKLAKFDETVEAHISLRLDKSTSVRDTLVFPNQFRGEKKVLVFCQEGRVQEALDAGAAYAGSDEYIEKVKGGWLDFDVAVATPDMRGVVGRLGRVLGPKGLMPNPKSGTVTFDVTKAIEEIKAGKVEYRLDKNNIVHVPVGKVSFGGEKLAENFATLMSAIVKAKPASAKGTYLRSITVASTMGPGVKINAAKITD